MKSFLVLSAPLFATVLLNAQGTQPARGAAAPAPTKPVTSVVFIDHTKTAEAFAKGGPLINAADMVVQGSHRDKAGQVEVHDKQTDILYILNGSATFVTGGTMVGGKVTQPGQWLGTEITGGETHQLVAGDLIVIPAGMPHWFKEVPKEISYYVVKVVKP